MRMQFPFERDDEDASRRFPRAFAFNVGVAMLGVWRLESQMGFPANGDARRP
jgi:hypothetical protein